MKFNLDGLPEELRQYIRDAIEMRADALRMVDKEIKHAMQEAINAIKKNIGRGVFTGVGKNLAEIIEEQKIIFAAELERIIQEGLTKAGYAGLSIGANILNHYQKKGLIKITRVHKDVLRQAELIAESTFKKRRKFKEREFVLSDRIWDLSGNNMEKIKEILEAGINTDCVDVAKALSKYVKEGSETLAKEYPNMMERMGGRVPKNLNYEALRLARNEAAETYWRATVEGFKDNPAVTACKWLISNNRIPGFHDICDDYAYADNYGLGAGIYPVAEAPDKPHVNCLCCLAPVIDKAIQRGVGNTPPENWDEIKERLKTTKSFINMDELTEEQKEKIREQRREYYRKKKEERELEKSQKKGYNTGGSKDEKGNSGKTKDTDGIRTRSIQRNADTQGKVPFNGRISHGGAAEKSGGHRINEDGNALRLQAVSYSKGNPRDYLVADDDIKIDNRVFGKKLGQHAQEFGFSANRETDRGSFKDIILNIRKNSDEVYLGTWRNVPKVLFYIKGDDVVVTDTENNFITILKDGVNNARVKNARKQ
ncbi:hypothetical protein [Treponema phagedenis]|uniref:hypothetical protein n=1 Tax=Treponema phagedenis TaxID=162 RepID=UPI0011E7DB99|nr:hypothetical protein [Treponema phagedenis]QEK06205.1 hypothetical protein FUT80_05450 [Treponema phagedenis]